MKTDKRKAVALPGHPPRTRTLTFQPLPMVRKAINDIMLQHPELGRSDVINAAISAGSHEVLRGLVTPAMARAWNALAQLELETSRKQLAQSRPKHPSSLASKYSAAKRSVLQAAKRSGRSTGSK